MAAVFGFVIRCDGPGCRQEAPVEAYLEHSRKNRLVLDPSSIRLMPCVGATWSYFLRGRTYGPRGHYCSSCGAAEWPIPKVGT